MTSKNYDVSVSFAMSGTSGGDAMWKVRQILAEFELSDQLPPWEVMDAEELLGPDDTYAGRVTEGETAPWTATN